MQHFIPILGNDLLNKEDAEYIYHFLAIGSIGVIQMWLKGGAKKPAKEMAELILKSSYNGRAAFL